MEFNLKKNQIQGCFIKALLVVMWVSNSIAQTETVGFFAKPFSVEYEREVASEINAGIDRFMTNHTKVVTEQRKKYWNRRFESEDAYNKSVEINRKHLREITGILDTIPNVRLIKKGEGLLDHMMIGETGKCKIYHVEWTVIWGLKSEGLMLLPNGSIQASAVVIPDASETPEMYAGIESGPDIALQLAERGVVVLIPTLIDRTTKYSGNDHLSPLNPWMKNKNVESRSTNITHREWIWRQGFVMGKHIVGLEVQKVFAAVDWLKEVAGTKEMKTGVMGYGEGGLIAFYAAALDTRIDAAWVSGYFGPREKLWAEPVYRDIWGLLNEFGDAEIASLVAPRSLVIEAAPSPTVKEPLAPQKGQRNNALPGELKAPSIEEVRNEVNRAKRFFPGNSPVQPDISLIPEVRQHGSEKAMKKFLDELGLQPGSYSDHTIRKYSIPDASIRNERVFMNMQEYIQNMIPTAAQRRYDFLTGDYSSPDAWDESMEPYRQRFYHEMVGKIDQDLLPLDPKVRQIYDKPGWTGYEIVLQTWPGVYAWGVLAIPKDIRSGEKRPAVVLQHGHAGLPTTGLLVDSYHRVLPALANRGFVVFAPYNPYQFNIRKAHAIKANAFSVIIPQYQQILNFLQSHEYVDGNNIALYGKSWGGRTALRVPIVLKDFKASICNGYYNDWVEKVVRINYANSYFYTKSIGVYNWNMGNTFTHAEMAQLIAPRPFMVVAGYLDGVAAHELVASEFEKVKRMYFMMGIQDRVGIEFFNGGHVINGQGAFRFLHKHLDWPEPKNPTTAQQISR